MQNKLEINAAIQIAKTAEEVFEAIVDPKKMAGYFISQGSGRMEEGATVTWKFPEFEIQVPVKVERADLHHITFTWGEAGKEDTVDIKLEPGGGDTTVVRVTEGKREADEAGIDWLKGNTEGWANFLACLKAYLEYGINLRKGAFEFRRGEM